MSTYQVSAPDVQDFDGTVKPGVITQIEGNSIYLTSGHLFIEDGEGNDVAVFPPGHWARAIRTER